MAGAADENQKAEHSQFLIDTTALPSNNGLADDSAVGIVNKKSDWTMDMPKIDYQPEQESDDDSDSAAVMPASSRQ